MGASTLLVCTVGNPEPVVAAIKHWRPLRVRFVHSPQTKEDILDTIVRMAQAEGVSIDAGRCDMLELPDGDDLERCVDHLRLLSPEIEQWAARGPDFKVVVDFTGGTKCMSAALALQARRWPCTFSYVAGTARTKEGLGTVISGAEKVVHQTNPWDALGYQAIEDFTVLFDQRAFAAAQSLANTAVRRMHRKDQKRALVALQHLACAFDEWDRFQHSSAIAAFERVEDSANDLRIVLGHDKASRIVKSAGRYVMYLRALTASAPPSREHVLDLLANAKRRHQEGRVDDAVARIYRAIEAIAQCELAKHGFVSTAEVPIEQVPEPLRGRWSARFTGGVAKIALQDAYELLAALNDPVGKAFVDTGLDGAKSPLNERNRSILAHGFNPVSGPAFERLWTAWPKLVSATEAELPAFLCLR